MAQAQVQFTLNGAPCRLDADSRMPLLHALRGECGLSGTRFGCGAAQCGSCHVLVDGRSQPACDTPLWAVAGKSVTTVEGLACEGQPSALQQAFMDEDAGQCAYCLSGILITATELLQQQPDPSDAQVRQALDGHLCRCGAHNRIVRAVLRAAKAQREKSSA